MPTILLIDDNGDFRTIFWRKFTDLGYKVIAAADGVRGLQMVMDAQVDLILLDLNMPYRGGVETLQLIRSVQPEVRVLVLTAAPDEAVHAEARRLGVTDILIKPISIKDLVRAVGAALGEKSP